ncbi:hypothetical protein SEUCBS140593_008970 [Sporothrix eucalyptigena]|uniref:AB hydrolase-1 domain-containing protein n=1 Tax=Sporothrix eucalyptigena TaxID=1812306 RepID=A0ABP0CRJ7_9PEZI
MDIKHHVIKDFAFADGTVLPSVSVAYAVLNASAKKTALVVTCFRGRITNTCTFTEGALRDHRVVVAALLGNGESSSPSNTPNFPQATLDYRDCVNAQYDLLANGLHIDSLDVVVGFSMGGQTTYHWLVMYPGMVKNAVIICSSASTSGHNVQFLEGPRFALENSIDYVPIANRRQPDGSVTDKPCVRGIQAFGKAYSAWLTSAEWFDQESYQTLGFDTRADWDFTTTGPNYNGWEADDLLTMLGMWQRGDVKKTGPTDSLQDTLGTIKAPVLLMPAETDQYFRPFVSKKEAGMIPKATLKVIPSIWGHLAGSGSNPVDTQWMDDQIVSFLGSK